MMSKGERPCWTACCWAAFNTPASLAATWRASDLDDVFFMGSSAESVGARPENESALREGNASWDSARPRWSYHASSGPGVPQDAHPDDPQSGREVQVVRLRRGSAGGAGRRPGSGRGPGAPEEQPAVLFRVRPARPGVRPPGGTAVRVRAGLGGRGLPGLPDAARGLQPMWGDGRAGAGVRWQGPTNPDLPLVPFDLGQAAESERGRLDLPHVVG